MLRTLGLFLIFLFTLLYKHTYGLYKIHYFLHSICINDLRYAHKKEDIELNIGMDRDLGRIWIPVN